MQYDDISKKASDALNDDYQGKIFTKIKTKAGPVKVAAEITRATKDTKTSLLSKLAFTWAGPSGFSIDKLTMKPDGHHAMETSLKGLADGLKLTFKGDDGEQGDLGVEYTKGVVAATADCDIITGSKLNSSVCVAAKDNLNVGGSLSYDVTNKSLSSFSLGASMTQGNIFAAVTTSKFDSASLGLLYTVNSDLKIATSSSHSAEKPLEKLTVGCVFNAQNFGIVKGKFTSDGSIEAALVKDIAKGVTANPAFKISAHKPADTFTYGLGVTIG
jgi:hypothetical protein